mmetsp:Transcript_15536/g.23272  ORF Transcript_15536/g.23272 Transcript_15536/m.23272 type:complete len:94 (+) Transcript_15536:3634-3915(+)
MTDKNDNETSWTLTEVGASDNVIEHIFQTVLGVEYRAEKLYLKRCTHYTLSTSDSLGDRLDSPGVNIKISYKDKVLVDTNDGNAVIGVPIYFC